MAIRTAFGLGLYGAPADPSESQYGGLPFTIEETSGKLRGVRFSGWCLPEGTLDLETNRRVRTHHYPGQSEATQHVTGYDDGETTIRGRWCTHHLGAADYAVALTAGAEQSAFRSAEDLREYVQAIVRAGQPLRVEWAGVERRTSDVRLRVSHKSRLELFYELTFVWVGVSKFAALPVTDASEKASFDLLNAIGDLLELAQTPANMALDLADYADTQIRRVEGLAGELRRTLELYASVVTRTAQVAGRLVSLSATIQAEAKALRDTIRRIPAEAASAFPGGSGTVAAGIEARILADWMARTQRISGDVAAKAAQQAQAYGALTEPEVQRAIAVQGATDLRLIARREYGSTDAWTRIADYNGLTGSLAPAGTILLIPRLDKASAAA